MKRRFGFGLLIVILLLVSSTAGFAAGLTETEPNDTPTAANMLTYGVNFAGDTGQVGDEDYFSLYGANVNYGFIALLDTSASQNSKDGKLIFYDKDGTTVLETALNTWDADSRNIDPTALKGTGIALQPFNSDTGTYYLKVNEDDNDALMEYNLRVYETIVSAQANSEPDDNPSNASITSTTNSGAIDTAGDVDCFRFYGKEDDHIIIALDNDPEDDDVITDLVLEFYSPHDPDILVDNYSSASSPEFFEYDALYGSGHYTYCVRAYNPDVYGDTHTYKVGILRNGKVYLPQHTTFNNWTNQNGSQPAEVGDILTFNIGITNDDPLTIPGAINLGAYFDASCLAFQSATPNVTLDGGFYIQWNGLKTNLSPNETFEVTANFKALKNCNADLTSSIAMSYYFTGVGEKENYVIASKVFLPMLVR